MLRQAEAGNEVAVNDLLDRHRPALRRMVAARLDRTLRQRVDASDIVQDTMLEASRRLQDYLSDPTMPFALWLRHIAQDRMIDAHRRHRVAARRSVDREQHPAAYADRSSLDLAAMLADQELTPAAAAIRHELARRFRIALDQMEDSDQDILIMRHFEQLSNYEVAETLGISQPAAGMRYLRALRKLRDVLGDVASATD